MPMQWYSQPEGIMLLNVEPNSLVRLFNTTGLCLWSGRTTDYDLFIPMSERNIYLVQIVNNLGAVVLKVVK